MKQRFLRPLLVLSALSAVWVLLVPLLYFVTLDEGIVSSYLEKKRADGSSVITDSGLIIAVVVQYLMIPLLLSLGVWNTLRWKRHPTLLGVVAGILFGSWASTTLLVLPYIGMYPSLPAALMGAVTVGGPNAGTSYYLSILATNLLLYTVVGWLLVRRQAPATRRSRTST